MSIFDKLKNWQKAEAKEESVLLDHATAKVEFSMNYIVGRCVKILNEEGLDSYTETEITDLETFLQNNIYGNQTAMVQVGSPQRDSVAGEAVIKYTQKLFEERFPKQRAKELVAEVFKDLNSKNYRDNIFAQILSAEKEKPVSADVLTTDYQLLATGS